MLSNNCTKTQSSQCSLWLLYLHLEVLSEAYVLYDLSLYLEVLSDANVLYDLSLYLEVRSKANVLYDLSLPGGSVWCWPAASPWGTPWSPPPTGSRRSLPASLNGQKNRKFSTFSFIPVPNLLLVCNYTFSNNIFTPTTPSIWNNVKILTLTNNNQGCWKSWNVNVL